MTTLTVPSATSMARRPLSNHGMPKPPHARSPDFPHRFAPLKFASPSTTSGISRPRSPGPMSPPMSARSFGTFIDSEPSTPAYSPRLDYDWDDSTLVLLRPMSSSSEPSSPTEPVWEMVPPKERPQQCNVRFTSTEKGRPDVTRELQVGTRLAPPPRKLKTSHKIGPTKDINITDLSGKENEHPRTADNDEDETPADQSTVNHSAPFGKLASKMKLMLRRKSTGTNDKKKEKKDKERDYYGPEDDLHWTEM